MSTHNFSNLGEFSDGLIARIAVQRKMVKLSDFRDAVEHERLKPVQDRVGIADVMRLSGLLNSLELVQIGELAASGSIREQRMGEYHLLTKIGEGGMGAVYAAFHESAMQLVALKILPRELAESEDIVKRFKREGEIACRIRHLNIVGGIRLGQEKEGVHYFSMEFVDGRTSYELLQERGVFAEGEALRITRGILQGLQYASDAKLVHRDIKPENIMIAHDGVPKLLDMGLVKSADKERITRLTQTGMAVGTPHYISPEQARGERHVDTRSDIYALGATLYHFVTGSVPFEGNTAAVIMTKHLSEELDWPSDLNENISDSTSQLISRMMAKDKKDRYQKPLETIADIDLILTGRAPSGADMLPGASSIRQGMKISRAAAKAAKRDKIGTVLERTAKRQRSDPWNALFAKPKVAMSVSAVLVLINILLWGGAFSSSPTETKKISALRREANKLKRIKDNVLEKQNIKEERYANIVKKLEAVKGEELARLLGEIQKKELRHAKNPKVRAALETAEARADNYLRSRISELKNEFEKYHTEERRLHVLKELGYLHDLVGPGNWHDRLELEMSLLEAPVPSRLIPPAIEPIVLIEKKSLKGWSCSSRSWMSRSDMLIAPAGRESAESRSLTSWVGVGEGRLRGELSTRSGDAARIEFWAKNKEDMQNRVADSKISLELTKSMIEAAQKDWLQFEIDTSSRTPFKIGTQALSVPDISVARHGRIGFAFKGGAWRIRALTLEPILSDGKPLFEVDLRQEQFRNNWHGIAVDAGVRAVRTRRVADDVWLGLGRVPEQLSRNWKEAKGLKPIFEYQPTAQLVFTYEASGVYNLFAYLVDDAGVRFDFRLAGRPVTPEPFGLSIDINDFRNKAGAAPSLGSKIMGLGFGGTGELPKLLISFIRVVLPTRE